MRFQVSTYLPTLVIIWHFVYSQPSECEVVSHYINHSFQNVSHIMSLPFPRCPDGTTLLVNSEFLQWLLKPYVKALIHPPCLPTQLSYLTLCLFLFAQLGHRGFVVTASLPRTCVLHIPTWLAPLSALGLCSVAALSRRSSLSTQ